MTAHEPPPQGAFIRPVGRVYGYCLQILQIHAPSNDDPREVLECKRWGMTDGQPVRDGHQYTTWLDGLHQALPGVWKDQREFNSPRQKGRPLYYRLMTTGPTGQIDLI